MSYLLAMYHFLGFLSTKVVKKGQNGYNSLNEKISKHKRCIDSPGRRNLAKQGRTRALDEKEKDLRLDIEGEIEYIERLINKFE